MKTSPQDWVQWDDKEVLPYEGGISFHIRTENPCVVKNEFGLILGFGTGQQEIAVTGKGEITFKCKGDIWLRPSSRVQERLQASAEIFTSLDRPSPMSPEMQAIHRMMRRNEIERERDRQEMEKRFANRSREDARSESKKHSSKVPSKETEAVREDTKRSAVSSEDKEPDPSADAETAGVSEPGSESNEGSSKDS